MNKPHHNLTAVQSLSKQSPLPTMANVSGSIDRPTALRTASSLSSRSTSSFFSSGDDKLSDRRVSFSSSCDNVDFVYSSTIYQRSGYLQTRRSSSTCGALPDIADNDSNYFYCDDGEAMAAAKAKKLAQSRAQNAYVRGAYC